MCQGPACDQSVWRATSTITAHNVVCNHGSAKTSSQPRPAPKQGPKADLPNAYNELGTEFAHAKQAPDQDSTPCPGLELTETTCAQPAPTAISFAQTSS